MDHLASADLAHFAYQAHMISALGEMFHISTKFRSTESRKLLLCGKRIPLTGKWFEEYLQVHGVDSGDGFKESISCCTCLGIEVKTCGPKFSAYGAKVVPVQVEPASVEAPPDRQPTNIYQVDESNTAAGSPVIVNKPIHEEKNAEGPAVAVALAVTASNMMPPQQQILMVSQGQQHQMQMQFAPQAPQIQMMPMQQQSPMMMPMQQQPPMMMPMQQQPPMMMPMQQQPPPMMMTMQMGPRMMTFIIPPGAMPGMTVPVVSPEGMQVQCSAQTGLVHLHITC
jgi:hypothetical protein